MKRIYTVVPILACFAFYGCDKSEENIEENVVNEILPEFTASTVEGDTKTSLKGLDVIWSSDDRVAIFNGTTVDKEYKVKDGCSGSTTTTLTPVNQDFTAGTEGSEMDGNVAVYPYSAVNSCRKTDDGYKLSVNFPSAIRYSPYSFGEGAMPMVAVTDSKDDYNLSFKNLCGLLKLQLKGDGIKVKSIMITGNNSERIPTEARIKYSNNLISTIEITKTGSFVSLSCGDGVELNSVKSTDFYIALPPIEFSKGITMIVTTSRGIVEKKMLNCLEIERSKIQPMSEVVLIEEKQENNQILYSTYDGNVLTIKDKTAFNDANIISNEYINGQGIITFDRNVTIIGKKAFYWSENLKWMVLPETVTIIDDSAFDLCVHLMSVVIPNNIEWIGKRAFYACSNLVIEIPKNVRSIGEVAFMYCELAPDLTLNISRVESCTFYRCCGLKSIVLSGSVESIEKSAFTYCKNLVSLKICDGVKNIEEQAFECCYNLTKLVIPGSVESIGNKAFNLNYKLSVVELSNGIKTIGSNAFNCSKLALLVIPESITSIGEGAFYNTSELACVKILAKDPPYIGDRCFNSGQEIYVLPECVETYKADANWGKYVIKPIE